MPQQNQKSAVLTQRVIQVPAPSRSIPAIPEPIPRMNVTSFLSPPYSIASRTQSKISSAPIVLSLSPIASRTRSKHQAFFSHQIPTYDIHHAIQ